MAKWLNKRARLVRNKIDVLIMSLFLIFFILFGIFSKYLSDKILFASGLSGLIWLFFEDSLSPEFRKKQYSLFLPICIAMLVIWIFIKLAF